ncbi:MAG: ribonuclease H-like domain-containing protein [Candidatus Woesearchaeota archaeon]
MLKNTFCHIKTITPQKEQEFWSLGISSWDDFFERKNDLLLSNLSSQKKELISSSLLKSIKSIEDGDYSTFFDLPKNQHWRLYDVMRNKTCFLDIETTGLSKDFHDITLIGIHGAEGTKIFMRGKNLDDFVDELKKYNMIITFNGCCFDLPFLKRKYPELQLNQFHVDLRFALAKLGFRGGLKKIEVDFNISRPDDVEGVDGYEAVRLWYKYKKGDLSALARLEKYLISDVENLKILMDLTYDLLQKNTLKIKN